VTDLLLSSDNSDVYGCFAQWKENENPLNTLFLAYKYTLLQVEGLSVETTSA
jgi:hypothetical protein